MFEKYKKIIAVISSMLLIVGVFKFSTKGGPEVALEVTLDESSLKSTQIVVHVDGAVAIPGVYTLEEGDRVDLAIEKAGGLLETANTELINYAAVLEDGQKITILKKRPSIETKAEGVASESGQDNGVEPRESVVNDADDDNKQLAIYERRDYTALEKINYMTGEDFQAIPGIGEKISQDIIAYRESIGQFNDLNQLKEVSGIGEAKLEKVVTFLSN